MKILECDFYFLGKVDTSDIQPLGRPVLVLSVNKPMPEVDV